MFLKTQFLKYFGYIYIYRNVLFVNSNMMHYAGYNHQIALVKHNHQTALVILPLKVKAIVKAALASMFVLFEDFLV